jgi:hypothetical protein
MPLEKVGDTQAQADNLFMTQQSLVLLRNPKLHGKAVLPLRKGLRLAVLGPHGAWWLFIE